MYLGSGIQIKQIFNKKGLDTVKQLLNNKIYYSQAIK